MAIDLQQTAPPAPTTDMLQTTPPAQDQQGGPPATEQVSDTPSWQRASSREEALELLLADETLPSEVLTRHPRVSGIIGTKAKIQADDLRRQESERNRLNRRAQLAREGRHSELGEEVAGEYVPDPRLEMQQEFLKDAQRGLAPLLDELPAELRSSLEGKTYEGGFGDGLQAWTRELAQALMQVELPKAVAKAVKQREDDIRKSVRAEMAGEEPSPDVQSGTPPSGRTWRSVAEVEAAFIRNEATAADVRAARQRLPYRV